MYDSVELSKDDLNLINSILTDIKRADSKEKYFFSTRTDTGEQIKIYTMGELNPVIRIDIVRFAKRDDKN